MAIAPNLPITESCPVSSENSHLRLVVASLVLSAVALIGSLWLSIGMALKACPLCLYQRTFVMGIVTVLGIGIATGRSHRSVVDLLALPFAAAAFGIAAFHVLLEVTGKLECPSGIFGIGTAPQQSLAVETILLALISVGAVQANRCCLRTVAGATCWGLLLAIGAVVSAPPMPPTPTKAYESKPEICRPPFRSELPR